MTYSPGPNRLTPEARGVLQAIHDLSEERGVPPTLREITEVAGAPTIDDAARHLRAARAILLHLDYDRIDTPLAWATVALEDILEHLEVPA